MHSPSSSSPSNLYIPPDVIEEILQYLKNDIPSLHTCILLNRLWCVLTVPYLWCNPFNSVNNRLTGRRNEISRNRWLNRNGGVSIIRQIVSNLDDDERRTLGDVLGVDLTGVNKTRFDYPTFMKVLDYDKILWSVTRWIEAVVSRDGKEELSEDCRTSVLEKRVEILKIIIGTLFDKSSGFRDINIIYNPSFYRNSLYPPLIDLKFLDSTDSTSLSKLQKFTLVHYSNPISPPSDLSNTQRIINNLITISNHTHKLDHLKLQIHNETRAANLLEYGQAFCEVIKAQQKLRVLEMNDFFFDDDSSETASSISDDEEDSMLEEISLPEMIIETFRTSQVSRSLRYLKIMELSLSNFEFLLEILSICKNLETLELCDMFPPQSNASNVSLTYDFFYPASSSQPPVPQISLKNLVILSNTPSNSRFTFSAIMTLLQLANHSLISFTLLQDISCSNSAEIYHALSALCPNLTHRPNPPDDDGTLQPHNYHFNGNSYLCQYFSSPPYTNIHNLSQSLPKSLKQFTFDFFMNTKNFKLFFEQCGSDRLSVVGMLNKNMTCDEYLEILSGYSEVRECRLELRCRRGVIPSDESNNHFHLSHRKSGSNSCVVGKDRENKFSKVGMEKVRKNVRI
ncbi:5655_t:CDS:2, partial [Acaulospora colombiana]